jgi:hypothetical protein
VARNWNPGLSLDQQKDAVYKVADSVYNAAPCYNDSVIGRAIPGLDVHQDYTKESDSVFGKIKVKATTVFSPSKVVPYTTADWYNNRYYSEKYSDIYVTWNPYYAMWRSIDVGTTASKRVSAFEEIDETKISKAEFLLKHHDIYSQPHIYGAKVSESTSFPNNNYFANPAMHSRFYFTTPNSNTSDVLFNYSPQNAGIGASTTLASSTGCTYKLRESGDFVKVTLEKPNNLSENCIRVQTDDDVARAMPAKCNVDIVLAIPVNGAACNENNRDAASDTAGTPYYAAATTINANAQLTPIYQIVS